MNFLKNFWIVLSLTMALPSHAEWKYVAEDNIGNQFFVDDTSVKRNEIYTYYWGLGNFVKIQGNGWRSTKVYYEVDCNVPARSRPLAYYFFQGTMGNGVNLTDDPTPVISRWKYPVPGSIFEQELKYVCMFD